MISAFYPFSQRACPLNPVAAFTKTTKFHKQSLVFRAKRDSMGIKAGFKQVFGVSRIYGDNRFEATIIYQVSEGFSGIKPGVTD